jgi:hypothetical protein
MRQSRTMSAIEAVANIIVGIGVAYAGAWYALQWLGVEISRDQNLALTAIMTVISFVRQYGLRRIFEVFRS